MIPNAALDRSSRKKLRMHTGSSAFDRGVAKLPVRTDIVGVRLDVAPSDIIECNVPPYEAHFRIDLLQPEV